MAIPDGSFSTTQWSLVLAARAEDSRAREALAALCERYWFPIYAHVRRMRHDPDAAADLTQGFFTHLIEKRALQVATPERGRFRAFLKTSLRHYLANERQRRRTAKRGGGRPHVSLDFSDAEARFRLEPSHARTPEVLFEQSWARTILTRALERLRDEFSGGSSRERYRRLEPFLVAPPSTVRYRAIAEELGIGESAVKVAVHRLRRRFGDLLRAEVAETVDDPSQVDDEIRHLLTTAEGAARR